MFKKIIPIVLSLIMVLGMSTCVFAENTQAATIQKTTDAIMVDAITATPEAFTKIGADTSKFDSLTGINMASKMRDTWRIVDPVFVGNGTLTSSVDLYLVENTSAKTVFLKLASSNPNLMALLYRVNADGSLTSTGFGVYANAADNYGVLGNGTYAIAIGSASGDEHGNYTLMWNQSNPSGANAILDKTSDLARVVLFYDNNKILSNGANIITDLVWEEHETWYMPNGYSGRDMIIDNITSKGTFIGTFSSSAPYSTDRALFIDVSQGSYLYFNSYYENILGEVTHVMNYFDPSGLETPRKLGTAPTDFNWGNHYIVIDLNSFQVVDFLSPFNYHYTTQGGRTFTIGNTSQIG